jgi:hypothetical protein
MRDFQLRKDLQRVVIDGFALPLGIAPAPGQMRPPVQGYTVSYMAGQDDEPDTYSFHVVVSHERLAPIVHRAFELLPDHVYAIVEIGSRDAYRSTDVYIGQAEEPISIDEFRRVWDKYEPFLLEDGSIAAGANSEEPFIEVFVDQWKGLLIHVPLPMREEVESMLRDFGLEEVPQTWPTADATSNDEEETGEGGQIRPVLDLTDETSPDIDEMLLNLRHDWNLELNIDRESNVDEGGRKLGSTLWHAVVIVDSAVSGNGSADDHNNEFGQQKISARPTGAYASIWATAASMDQMEQMIADALEQHPEWVFGEIFTIDRVAYDERPDELADLPPNRREPEVHLVTIEPWGPMPSEDVQE